MNDQSPRILYYKIHSYEASWSVSWSVKGGNQRFDLTCPYRVSVPSLSLSRLGSLSGCIFSLFRLSVRVQVLYRIGWWQRRGKERRHNLLFDQDSLLYIGRWLRAGFYGRREILIDVNGGMNQKPQMMMIIMTILLLVTSQSRRRILSINNQINQK